MAKAKKKAAKKPAKKAKKVAKKKKQRGIAALPFPNLGKGQ